MNCAICGVRKAKRACPGVHGDICTLCCGTEREESIDCPLDCEYLRAAHEHETAPAVPQDVMPDPEVVVDEDFIRQYEWVLMLTGSAIVDAYREFPAITDHDTREALAALVKTYQTMDSGLVYETKPTNPYAAAICDSVQARVTDIQKRLTDNGEPGYLQSAAVLKLLIFLKRLEYLDNNGRKRSRSFLDMMNRSYVSPPKTDGTEESHGSDAPEAAQVVL